MTLFAFQLKSSDNVEFCVDLEIARKSMTIRTMLDDLGGDLGLPDEDPGLLTLKFPLTEIFVINKNLK